MKAFVLLFSLLLIGTNDCEKVCVVETSSDLYQVINRDIQIDVFLSDTAFYYFKYQDVFYHFVQGSYILNSDGILDIVIDTVSTKESLVKLNSRNCISRYGFPPNFEHVEFQFFSDTLKCSYQIGERKAIFLLNKK